LLEIHTLPYPGTENCAASYLIISPLAYKYPWYLVKKKTPSPRLIMLLTSKWFTTFGGSTVIESLRG
jgi:hypothetical protein